MVKNVKGPPPRLNCGIKAQIELLHEMPRHLGSRGLSTRTARTRGYPCELSIRQRPESFRSVFAAVFRSPQNQILGLLGVRFEGRGGPTPSSSCRLAGRYLFLICPGSERAATEVPAGFRIHDRLGGRAALVPRPALDVHRRRRGGQEGTDPARTGLGVAMALRSVTLWRVSTVSTQGSCASTPICMRPRWLFAILARPCASKQPATSSLRVGATWAKPLGPRPAAPHTPVATPTPKAAMNTRARVDAFVAKTQCSHLMCMVGVAVHCTRCGNYAECVVRGLA